jgi:hypothetical protein
MLHGRVSAFLGTIWKWYTASQMLRLKAHHWLQEWNIQFYKRFAVKNIYLVQSTFVCVKIIPFRACEPELRACFQDYGILGGKIRFFKIV